MKLAFLSGPYRADNTQGVSDNIEQAKEAAIKYWQLGYAVICPHLNTAHFDGLCPDDTWLEGDLEILSRCDVVVMIRGWQLSEGASYEHHKALEWGKEIIYEVEC